MHRPYSEFRFTGPSTSKGAVRFIGLIKFKDAGEIQGFGDVGSASGIRCWPVMARRSLKSVMPVRAGKSLKLAKSLAADGDGEAGDVHFLYAGLKKPLDKHFSARHRHERIPPAPRHPPPQAGSLAF